MHGTQRIKHAMLGLACIGLLVPRCECLAAQPAKKVKQSFSISDIALADGNVLQGHLVDSEGKGLAGEVISVQFENKEIATAVTKKDGSFAVKNLRAGQHVLVAGKEAAVVRLWAPKTAPPKSRTQALMVRGSSVVRGQLGGIDMVGVATLVLAGIAMGYAINNNDKLKDLEGQVDKLPTSL